MVFYLKYRPQKISELDSLEISEKISSILSQSVPHAFLFTGPKGLGKTSTARIVAKTVNCTGKSKIQLKSQKSKDQGLMTNDQIEPCNACEQCISITNGTNLDVLEIDGASNRGIDEIRDLREKIKLSTVSARKKVYIIDEVHMLTTEAFNALLKTLEEPPSHAMFILCTTEPRKVPETIISRSFHIPFKKATSEELVRSLKRIAKGEGLKIDKDCLLEIAKLADGGFRDGAKVLEELVFLSKGQAITKEIIEQKYQISNIKYQISNMIELLVKKDTKGALGLVSKLVEQGVDMKYFIEQMIDNLHKLLLVEVGVGVAEDGRLKIEDGKLEVDEIRHLIELLARANGELKYAVLPQLPLELAIIEWTIVQKTQNTQNTSESDDRKIRKSEESDSPLNSTMNTDIWQKLIEQVKTYNHSIAGVLRGCLLKNYNKKELVIETKYKFHKDRLLEPKTIEILAKSAQEITGEKVKIVVELKK